LTLPRDLNDKQRDRHGLREGLEGLRDLMDRLLSDDGCPWDRAQSLATLEPYLIEETYEVLGALNDPSEHRLELGDLLFQIVFQSALREREGAFSLDDVVSGIRDKMIRRHPHVFSTSDKPAADAPRTEAEASQSWARIKQQERSAGGPEAENSDPLARIPQGLPGLQRAWRLQDGAAQLGFDWPDLEGPLAKVDEEWAELRSAIQSEDRTAIEDELGDLLFVLVRLAQKLQIQPEAALRSTNNKFQRRFAHVLRRCTELDLDPKAAGLEKLDQFWNEAKRMEP